MYLFLTRDNIQGRSYIRNCVQCLCTNFDCLCTVLLNIHVDSRISQRSFKGHGNFWGTYCLHLQGSTPISYFLPFASLTSLHLVSEGCRSFLRIVDRVLPECTVSHLRRYNSFFLFICFLVIYWLFQLLQSHRTTIFPDVSINVYKMNCVWPNRMLWPHKGELTICNKHIFLLPIFSEKWQYITTQ
jgi:hypothetical protein